MEKRGRWSFDRASGYREERIVLTVGEPLMPQKHVCVQRPIFYENRNAEDAVTPPMLGRHRERWPAWGEYEYLPPQRWLHAIEHGGLAFLYNHCLKEEDVCLIRRYIQRWKLRLEGGDLANSRFRGADRGGGGTHGAGEFRFIMTPFKNLQRALAVVTWSEMYMSKGFNQEELDAFIDKNYRKSWEDYQTSGNYNYLWTNISRKDTSSCANDVKWTFRYPEQKWAAADITATELADIKNEQLFLRRVVSASLGLGIASCVAMAVMMRVMFRFIKRTGTIAHERLEDFSQESPCEQ